MRCILALVLTLFALNGCTAAPAATWAGDDRFTPAQRADIETALAWMSTNAGAPEVDIVWGPAPVVGCERAIIAMDLPDGTAGDSDKAGCIRVDVSQGADRVGVIVAHEMGHVRGAKHHDGPGLMNRVAPKTIVWNEADAADLAAASE